MFLLFMGKFEDDIRELWNAFGGDSESGETSSDYSLRSQVLLDGKYSECRVGHLKPSLDTNTCNNCFQRLEDTRDFIGPVRCDEFER